MLELLKKNWGRACSEVLSSVVGSLGFIYVIAIILSIQNPPSSIGNQFSKYFAGGQITMSILPVAGVAFMALLRHKATHQVLALILLITLVFPIVATSFIIGLNPGFETGGLKSPLLTWLWVQFFGLHVLWFIILLLEPKIPTAQQAGEDQENRVNSIKLGANRRAE
ncbi:hypothetical protein HNP73_001151 [Amaricoccus macauensis]|uniref:Uncharacterized protein n=1 Tax=Amaricoccus macauensis TaxID=57001 RepID=A0A840SKD9_9RHOB|nr:hypothetical protein [Amaricoccus macauensis]MBB5221230.1 hypothetical protein [Amaricoccus macauensis]